MVCELLVCGAHVDAMDADGITPLVASIGGKYTGKSLTDVFKNDDLLNVTFFLYIFLMVTKTA